MKSKDALIIVDIQNDFCPGGALAVNEGDNIIPIVNKLSKKFRVVTATQDWHPINHISFASSHENKKEFDQINFNGIEQVLWPDHCVAGSKGALFHHNLETDSFNLIIRKGAGKNLDSYSTFLENDKKTKTGLDGYLKSLEIENIYICGLATDYCVYYSAMDSISFGFNTYVIEDACRGIDVPEGTIDQAIKSMKDAGINIIQSSEILNG